MAPGSSTPMAPWRGGLAAVDQRLLNDIESWSRLDAVAKALQRTAAGLLKNHRLRGTLSGSSLGHPLHPALTDVPIGCVVGAVILDLSGQSPRAGRRLLGTGVVLAAPTALAGLSDWLDTEEAEQRVGLVHAIGNVVGLSLMGASWWRRRDSSGQALAAAGLGAIAFSGWLGGHLSYGMGVGVDTNAFETGPQEWEAAAPKGEAKGAVRCYEADGVRLAVVETEAGLSALADRCSHRGGPLSEGTLEGDCLECPWHGSRFERREGSVRRGPASVPQPVYEVRKDEGSVVVRRAEPRALRRNPV